MNNNQDINNEEQLSFRDIVRNIKLFYFEVLNNWKILILFILPFVCYFGYKALNAKVLYPATLTFMVNEDEGGLGSMSAASGILGSLGIGGVQEYNLDKILELAKSNRIVNEVLLSKVNIDNKEDLLANHIIDIFKIPSVEWKKDTILNNNFRFKHSNPDSLNKKELRAIKSLYKKVIGTTRQKGIITTTSTKATSIMSLSAETPNESLTIEILKQLYKRLGDFYIEKSIEKQKYTYEVIIRKADSLRNLLQGKEYNKAKIDDSSRGLILEQSKVPSQRLNRDVNMLSIMYTEAIKNAEVADFAMKSKVPFVQAIDIPFAPLSPQKASLLLNLMIGLAIGLFLGVTFIILRKVIKDAL